MGLIKRIIHTILMVLVITAFFDRYGLLSDKFYTLWDKYLTTIQETVMTGIDIVNGDDKKGGK